MNAKSTILLLVVLVMACGNSSAIATLEPALPLAETLPPQSTVTRVPTITPIPSNTAPPTFTATAESADPYYDEMRKRFNAYQAANIKFARQYDIFKNSPLIISDASWKSNTESVLLSLQVAAEDLQNIPDKTPPYEKIDKAIKQLADETLKMIKNFTAGINGPDSLSLERSRNNLAMMRQYAGQLNNALAQLSPADFALAPSSTALPTTPLIAFPTSGSVGGACSCGGNFYNCSTSDFSSERAAQNCYEHCLAVVGRDVHGLDANSDGIACNAGLD
jgi:hypothetical protein